MNIIKAIIRLHNDFFAALERWTEGWFLGLFARFTFLAVLFFYFFNSWKTKTGDGVFGFLLASDGAYYQIVPWAMEAAGGDTSMVGFFNHLIVHAGTLAEIFFPVLIVLGLFTRFAAVGMIGFIAVQSFVDIRFHGVDATTAGMWFDRASDALIWDQRMFWVFLLVYLAVKGAGKVSLDHLLASRSRG
ncbi:MAG: DoxX family protein [Nitratireductor sp.]